jgi:ribosomal protein L13E
MNHDSIKPVNPQHQARKPIVTERKSAARPYEYLSSLMPCLRQQIIDSLRAGRGLKQVAAEYGVTRDLALELWVRADLRRMELRLAALEDRFGPPTRLRMVA